MPDIPELMNHLNILAGNAKVLNQRTDDDYASRQCMD